ncbi:hypothetical protein O181_025994 [Austropuccinia psidii MF-1]|uniref:Uncharacterized protein n=1 Tax=Austropuccinia psidii MF-1 TaxID=1389203 RepID=A0A9Q3H174_9BASI|nr:hypothetical protein [Austropuccinia psidii MF-1]
MQKMTQIMANFQAASSSESSRPPAINNLCMKAPECFDGTQPFKGRSFIQSFQFIFHNYPANFSQDKRKRLFEYQLFTLFGGPNSGRKAESELDSLRMKEGGHVSLTIAYFSSLVSRIGDWGEKAFIHHFRKTFSSRIVNQLASHPSRIDSIQDLMNITLELYTRYHERQKEKKPEASK